MYFATNNRKSTIILCSSQFFFSFCGERGRERLYYVHCCNTVSCSLKCNFCFIVTGEDTFIADDQLH